MPVSQGIVARLAEMTRIGLQPGEVERLSKDMEAILEHVGRLQSVDTSQVGRGTQVTGLHDVFREDAVEPSLTVDQVLANAPERDGNFFAVPAVLGEQPEG